MICSSPDPSLVPALAATKNGSLPSWAALSFSIFIFWNADARPASSETFWPVMLVARRVFSIASLAVACSNPVTSPRALRTAGKLSRVRPFNKPGRIVAVSISGMSQSYPVKFPASMLSNAWDASSVVVMVAIFSRSSLSAASRIAGVSSYSIPRMDLNARVPYKPMFPAIASARFGGTNRASNAFGSAPSSRKSSPIFK